MVSISLKGKVAVITGAGGGLGAATALKFAEAGAKVMVSDLNYENAKDVAEQIKKLGSSASAIKTDVTKFEDAANLVETTVKEFGTLDIMVNAAGIGLIKPIQHFTQEEIESLLDVDLKGVIFCCKAALEYMQTKKEGKIVNFSSIGAKAGMPGVSVYAGAKAGVIAVTQSLAREAAEYNINVNAVCPGIIRTAMWENQLNLITNNADENIKDEVFNKMISEMIPLKRPQEPEDIANMVLFLSSDLANNITGQTINIDGGTIIY